MSWKVVNLVADRRVGSPARKLVLIAMADRANPDGSGVYASFATIADMAEVSRPTAKRIVKEFLDEGLIIHVGERECQYGKTNVYDLDITSIAALPVSASAEERAPEMNRGQNEPGENRSGVKITRTGVKMTPKPNPQPNDLLRAKALRRSTPTKKPKPDPKPKAENGHALPDDWRLEPWMTEYAAEHAYSDRESAFIAMRFENHWRSLSGAKARKKDWRRTFQNWVTNEKRWQVQQGAAAWKGGIQEKSAPLVDGRAEFEMALAKARAKRASGDLLDAMTAA